MRGKVAKALRREARLRSQGAPLVAYVERKKAVTKPTFYADNRGVQQRGSVRTVTTETRLDPNCTKGIYRQLKNQWKAGAYQPSA